MSEQQEIELNTVCFPIARGFAVVLFLDYNLFRFEPCHFKNTHSFKR